MSAQESKRLYRRRDGMVIGGVCTGIGEYFDIDPVVIRLLFILAVLLGGSGILAYIIAWIAIPEEPEGREAGMSTAKKGADPTKVAGVILIVIGILALGKVLGFYWVFKDIWRWFWPALLIALGVIILIRPGASGKRDKDDDEEDSADSGPIGSGPAGPGKQEDDDDSSSGAGAENDPNLPAKADSEEARKKREGDGGSDDGDESDK
jgi:phage shock protein PspC (stress-responsive transcriptional regulator)